MATETYFLSGKAKWAKLITPDEKYQNWQTQLYMDEESMKLYDLSGMGMQKKKDEDGTYVTFRRPMTKVIKGELIKFDPPEVIDEKGNLLKKPIGNGSEVTIKVIVYDTVKGKGHRLEKVKVNKLVEYTKEGAAVKPEVAAAQAAVGAIPF